MTMRIGVPREVHPQERRVAVTPQTGRDLQRLGFEVHVEAGAGEAATYGDEAYREAGVSIATNAEALWAVADVVLKVRPPEAHPGLGLHEATLLREGAYLVSFIWPAQNQALLERLAARKATVLAMDTVPRISRAQRIDALSSMANIAGYRAVIEAAHEFGRLFSGQITAAGTMAPAKVLVIGAGVAGLAAIGAAHGLGAVVRAFDTRPEVKEQVESMGAEFLELDFAEKGSGEGGYAREMSPEFIKAEMDLFARQAMEVDVIITTALVPGKKSPELITAGMVESMRDGSVIVDLAAEQGGNCALTRPGQVIRQHGVTVIGYTDLPSRMPAQASELYGTNLRHLVEELCPEGNGEIVLDFDDDVIRGATVLREGEVTWPPPPPKVQTIAPPEPISEQPAADVAVRPRSRLGRRLGRVVALLAGAAVFGGIGAFAPASFFNHFTVFVLACIVGWLVIWNVTHALHTPLMSVTNAISGIIVVGALVQLAGGSALVTVLACVAVLIATINIAGGFLVTHRMLQMFRKED